MDFKRAFDRGRKKNMQGKWRRFEETTGGIFGRCIEYIQVKTFEENIQLVFKMGMFQTRRKGVVFEIKGLKNLVQKIGKMEYPKVWCVSNGFV